MNIQAIFSRSFNFIVIIALYVCNVVLLFPSNVAAQDGRVCVYAQVIGDVVVLGIWNERGTWRIKYAHPTSMNGTIVRDISENTREMYGVGWPKSGTIKLHWYSC